MKEVLITFICTSYVLIIAIGTAILVQNYNWSAWWFMLLPVLCSLKIKYTSDEDDKRTATND